MNKRRRHAAKRRRAFTPTFVNAYAVELMYGGREEGGWWYDIGSPLDSVRVRTLAGVERVRARARLLATFASLAGRPRHLTNGGPDIEVYVEEQPAAAFPARRRYYE